MNDKRGCFTICLKQPLFVYCQYSIAHIISNKLKNVAKNNADIFLLR